MISNIFYMFIIFVNTLLESGNEKCSYFYESVITGTAELILRKQSGEDSDNVLTGMVKIWRLKSHLIKQLP